MTHCANYRAAAVARATTVCSIGIDAEPHEPLPENVLDAISLPDEATRLGELAAADDAVSWGSPAAPRRADSESLLRPVTAPVSFLLRFSPSPEAP